MINYNLAKLSVCDKTKSYALAKFNSPKVTFRLSSKVRKMCQNFSLLFFSIFFLIAIMTICKGNLSLTCLSFT